MGFWTTFAVEEALTVVSAFLATQQQNLTTQQQADLQALVAAAQKVLTDFSA